jgi:hypothetical protein
VRRSPKYETNDTEGVLPKDLHKKAIGFARKVTGLQRPHRSQTVFIEAYRQCFKDMQELNMVSKEFKDGEEDKEG